MKIQTSVFIIVFTFVSFIPTTSAITKAESRLKKVYLDLGLSSQEASSYIKKIKLAFKEIANAKKDKETLKLQIIPIFEFGLIIDLSENGKKILTDAVRNIINDLPQKKLKKKVYLELRNIIFEWLKNQLGQYDETSFNLAYTLQNNPQAETEICVKQNTSSNPYNIFIYDIQLKSNVLSYEDLEDDESSSLENSFELLSLDD